MKRVQFNNEASAALAEEISAFKARQDAIAALWSADRRDRDGVLLMTDSLEAMERVDAANERVEAAKAKTQRYIAMIGDGSIED